jgi:hypothetical protein
VLVAAGAGMMNHAFPDTISRSAAVVLIAFVLRGRAGGPIATAAAQGDLFPGMTEPDHM